MDSISVDLIYGLPKQTFNGFKQTLASIIAAKPDRIALYHYAHMPTRIKAQALINESELPTSAEKLKLLGLSINTLVDAGYQHIGMDHFALPDDPLCQSLAQDTLHRNFQGYSTHGDCDIIGMGISAISQVAGCYSQNHKQLKDYQTTISNGQLAVERGYSLSDDDRLRAEIIQQLMCRHILVFDYFERMYSIMFTRYFASELNALEAMAQDQLLTIDNETIKVTEKGCLMLRNIAMVFDLYLQNDNPANRELRFSKVL